jgi:hypothetical protein
VTAQDSYRIDPTGTSILDIPVSKLDPAWEVASLVNEANLPKDAKDDLARATDPHFRFVLEGDFNRDKRPDRVVVGVYRTRGGDEGQFLLILTDAGSKKWEVSYLSKYPGSPGPSLLYHSPDALTWVPCTACDVWADVSWKRGRYRTEWAETDVE